MSIMKIMEASYYNEQESKWEKYAPKSIAKAIETEDGSNVQVKLDAIPGQITAAADEIRGGVTDGGNTLAKLYNTINAIQTLLESDDVSLDTIQEITDYIKANRDDLTLMGQNKVNCDDIINNLTTIGTVEGKALDARQGKVLKDLIDTVSTGLSGLQIQAADFATKAFASAAAASIMPVVKETAPANPTDGLIWLKPVTV